MPSLEKTLTGEPSRRKRTFCTVGNWVSVYTTWPSRVCIESAPPPDWYSEVRSTVARPSRIAIPISRVPSGTALVSPAERSSAVGPCSSALIAAVATSWVGGCVRRTATSPLSRANHTSSESWFGFEPVCSGAVEAGAVEPGWPSQTACCEPQPANAATASSPSRAASVLTSSVLRRPPPCSLRLVLLVERNDRARVGLQDADPERGSRLQQPAMARVLALHDLRQLGDRDRDLAGTPAAHEDRDRRVLANG